MRKGASELTGSGLVLAWFVLDRAWFVLDKAWVVLVHQTVFQCGCWGPVVVEVGMSFPAGEGGPCVFFRNTGLQR